MPSDANGVYSLPPGYLAVTGNTIQPSQHNPPLEDIAAALTARLSANGANPMTGQFKAVDGLVGSPAISFNTAQTTGMYKTAGGNIALAIAGTKVAEFGPAGTIQGAKFIGEIFDWTGTTAPALCVLPFGQTLSRTAYADLWTFAQIQIAAGNTLYNNGNGSTTFGIPDMRGRVRATKDDMGGSAASRLTSATISPNGTTLGAASTASETKTLVTANLPPYTPAGSVTVVSTVGGIPQNTTSASSNAAGGARNQYDGTGNGTITSTGTLTGTAQGGTSTAFPIVQPTIITNCALFAGA